MLEEDGLTVAIPVPHVPCTTLFQHCFLTQVGFLDMHSVV
jgi:hypothetical protein